MHRRQFVSLLGGAAAWPLAARAQQRAAPVVGLLAVGTLDASRNDVQAFLKGLGQIGFAFIAGLGAAAAWPLAARRRNRATACERFGPLSVEDCRADRE